MPDATSKVRSIAPVFLVSDVKRSATYYSESLGFTYERFWGDPPSAVMVKRDNQLFMLNEHSHGGGPGDTNPNGKRTGHGNDWDAYVWADDVNALFKEFALNGADIVQQPVDQTWGMREIVVRDPDGYHICFGSDISGD